MNQPDTTIFLDHFKFTEGLRWHKNHLWFCDVWDQKIYCVDTEDNKLKEISIDDQPVGLGWLSDGSLLITSFMKRELLKYDQHQLSLYLSLALAAPGYCHDFTVAKDNTIYLSASGFMPGYQVKLVTSNILMITPEKEIKIAAKNIGYPNGIIITPDEKHLIVAETFAASLLIFDIDSDGLLVNKKIWAKFDDLGFQVQFDENGIPIDKNRHYPDGICFDKKLNSVWVASPARKEVVCVNQQNEILKTVHTTAHPFDCVLGGEDKRTLFIASSDMSKQERTGKIEQVRVA